MDVFGWASRRRNNETNPFFFHLFDCSEMKIFDLNGRKQTKRKKGGWAAFGGIASFNHIQSPMNSTN